MDKTRSKTRTSPTREPADPEVVHIELPGQPTDSDFVVMYCGAIVTFDDGSVCSEDYYHHNAGYKATCEPCKDVWNSS